MSGMTFLTVSRTAEDVPGEARASFAAVDEALAAEGLTFRDIVKTRLLYSVREDFPEMNSVRDPLYRSVFTSDDFPAATGVITGGRGSSSPRFELEVIAAPGKAVTNSDGVVRRFGEVIPPFSHLNEASGIAFMSGQGAFDLDAVFRAGSAGEEAAKALATFDATLPDAGRTPADIVALTVYLTPPAASGAAYDEVMAVVAAYVGRAGGAAPVITCVGVLDLAFEGMTVEIEAVAGPPGAEHRVAAGPAAPSGLGPLPLGSSAVQAGGVVVATATSATVSAAAAALAASVQEVGGLTGAPLVTVWHTHEQDGVAAVQAALPGAVVSLVPMAAGPGVAAVTLELFGNAR
jgi:enamine deaminase RidA (YjgF/YER057c/UK114 family)